MATEMEDLAMIRAAESVEDALWTHVTQWSDFARDTLGRIGRWIFPTQST